MLMGSFDPFTALALASAALNMSPELLLSSGATLVVVVASHFSHRGRLIRLETIVKRIDEHGSCAHPNCPFGYHEHEEEKRK